MMNIGNRIATRATVRDYLHHYFDLTPGQAEALCDKHRAEIETAVRMSSRAYYPGDRIADAEHLSVRPGMDPDESDTEEDDGP